MAIDTNTHDSSSLVFLVALAALATAAVALLTARQSASREMSPREASDVVKEAARNQQVEVELNEKQMAAIQEQWNLEDPTMPADVTFTVEDRPEANMRVASYSYSGSVCCV